MKKIMKDKNNKPPVIKAMRSEQHIIQEEGYISAKKVLDDKLYEEDRKVIVPVDGQLYEKDRKVVVPFDGLPMRV